MRLQSGTIASGGVLDGYILHINNSVGEAVLGRQVGGGSITTLATIAINPVLDSTGAFRMRLRAVGTNPVRLNAYIERLDGASWTIVGQATYDDASSSRIAGRLYGWTWMDPAMGVVGALVIAHWSIRVATLVRSSPARRCARHSADRADQRALGSRN